MLGRAVAQLPSGRFSGVAADMLALPFPDRCFDHAISITALEFIADGGAAIRELFRVTRPGGRVLAATLNSLSPWAQRRAAAARVDPGSVFRYARFRSPHELMAMAPVPGEWRTAIFFDRRSTPDTAAAMENATIDRGHGAFLAGLWTRPG